MLIEQARKAIEQLQELADDPAVGAGEVLELTKELHTLANRLHGVHHTWVRAAERSGMWGVAGYRSATAWLMDSHRIHARSARRLLRNARWLTEHDGFAAGLNSGELSVEHVEAVRRVVTRSPARERSFPTFADELCTVASNSSPERTSQVMRAWAETVDSMSADSDAAEDFDRRCVYLSPVADGYSLSGWLPAAEGAEIAGILNEYSNRLRRSGNSEAPASRRADALLELVRDAATALPRNSVQRAQTIVLVSAERLVSGLSGAPIEPDRHTHGRAPGTSFEDSPHVGGVDQEHSGPNGSDSRAPDWSDSRDLAASSPRWQAGNTDGSGFLANSELRRVSCDGEVRRLVMSAQSVPLDLGRSVRTAPPHMRQALLARDQGCCAPGCSMPPGWTEAHHIVHWADGGRTAMGNMALLCHRHHRELHHGRWVISMREGLPLVQRPEHITTARRD